MLRAPGMLLIFLLAAAANARDQFQGETALRAFDPSSASWEVNFERDQNGVRLTPRASIRKLAQVMSVRLPADSGSAVGIAVVPGHHDLSRYEEIHLWVRSDVTLRVQPFSQTSGFVFRDGGDPDAVVPGDGRIVRVRILRASMADPSMVETIGIQVRPASVRGTNVEVLSVTGIPLEVTAMNRVMAISDISVPATAPDRSVVTIDFNLSRTYENPYDPAQIDVQARFTAPSRKEIVIPAFWFQDFTVAPGTQKYEQYLPDGAGHWRVRFLPSERGLHSVRLSARDRDGNSDESAAYSLSISPGTAPGPVRRHPANPLLLEYENGAPYHPLGHNLGFEDGNPDLNGTAYYRSLLPLFASSGENWTRFWMTDFARTTLEWDASHFSGFYQGIGIYSLRAAWRVDRLFETALANNIQVQLVIVDHGQVSNWVNARWDSGNPYNSSYGGPVPQGSPERFFSDPVARNLFRRRLRYIVARWAAFPNLLAWELFNEVQWAGSRARNIGNDSETRAAIVDWHREMADYVKAQDPFGHLVTTSSEDYSGSPGFASIWSMASIDMVQSHHYGQPPAARDSGIRNYVASAQRSYGKPVIVGEMGVKADSQPESDFDPEGFLTNPNVPASERTAANRDHLREGTTLRNGIWSAALSRSGAMNWWWGSYVAEDQRRHREPPHFPLNARLYPPLVSFLGGEDLSRTVQENASLQTSASILAYGLTGPSAALVWVRDARNAYGSGYGPATVESRSTDGASVKLSGLEPGSYVLSLYDTYGAGGLVSQTEIATSGDTINVALPSFQGDIAFKAGDGVTGTWGAVPRSAQTWVTDLDDGAVRVVYAALRAVPGFPDAVGGAILTLSDGQLPTSEVTVPALRPSTGHWTVAEIGAPSHTGLALVNPNPVAATVLLVMYDENGKQQAARTVNLGPGEHVARFLVEPQWFGQSRAPFRGTLEVRSDQPLGALALRGTYNGRGDFIMTSIPARSDEVPQAGQTGILPQVADGGGYRTEWLMLNPWDEHLSGKVAFRRSDGSPWLLGIQGSQLPELPYSIPAHGLVRWTTPGSAPEVSVGYSLLTPDAGQTPPSGCAVIRYSPGGELLSETGLPLLPPSVTAGTYWEVGPELDTGVALVNTADREQEVRVELFQRDGGDQVRSVQVPVSAGGHTARFITQLFPDIPATGRGYVRFSADSPCGLLPLRMRMTPRGALFSSLLLGRLAGGEEMILPQVVHGGGYRTQFIIANPGELTSSGKISFFDPAGKPARLLLHRP